ncbi:hypothetical protein F5148DRAFT_1280903 [Russula earlei]|uniref:Uncharacterized protein n=1 Tax=Russula earlei TaxID=71964 RepID=A0ACC0UJ51_9AGAM|nr:hypothetical protein F5148DRAFT_1280903 [Russula earlei]
MSSTSAGTTDHSNAVHGNQKQSTLLIELAQRTRKGKEKESGPGPIRTSTTPPHRVKKLVPPRPFPTVSAAVSATGPRSAHHEGKNYVTITRKTKLGAYLRRCKDLVLKDGYKSLHLFALGAAIPHLCKLAESLPHMLPFSSGEIRTEILTGTVDVQDEVLPEDEDEEVIYRTRAKSSLKVVILIGDGIDDSGAGGGKWGARGKRRKRGSLISSRLDDGVEDGCDTGKGRLE